MITVFTTVPRKVYRCKIMGLLFKRHLIVYTFKKYEYFQELFSYTTFFFLSLPHTHTSKEVCIKRLRFYTPSSSLVPTSLLTDQGRTHKI